MNTHYFTLSLAHSHTFYSPDSGKNVLDRIAPSRFVYPSVDRVERRSDHVFFYKRSTTTHQLIRVLSKSSDTVRLVVNIDASPIPYAMP